jgi:hypothetical protein
MNALRGCDQTSLGYKLTLGYRTDTVFAVEAACLNAGRNMIADDTDDVDLSAKGFLRGVALRGTLTPELQVVGRFGVAMLDSRADGRLNGASFSQAFHGNQPCFGVGLEHEAAPQIKLTAAADFTKVKVGNKPVLFDCSASAGKLTSDRFAVGFLAVAQ